MPKIVTPKTSSMTIEKIMMSRPAIAEVIISLAFCIFSGLPAAVI